jgi:hypothetical protein
VFPGCLISKRLWPPRSPDVSPPDFFLWGHLKDTVYSNHPHTLKKLQANIQCTVDRISTGLWWTFSALIIRNRHNNKKNKIYIAFIHELRDFLNILYNYSLSTEGGV